MGHKKSKKGMTYAQRKRATLNYREEYFKHNPGIFGCVWKCAYCNCAIVGRHNVQVDHIIPLNCVAGRNSRFNLVSACGNCNQSKSDIVDGRIIQGYVSKGVDTVVYSAQKLVVIGLVGVWTAFMWVFHAITGILLYPLRNASLPAKCIIVGIYVAIGLALLKSVG